MRVRDWLLCLCLLAPPVALGAPPPSPSPATAPVPAQTGLLVDAASALESDAQQALEQRLRALQDSGRAQIGILIAPGLRGEPLADYALRVAQTWQLGHQGRDDGLLVVVVPGDKAAVRIDVGYGLEGAIPDVLAGQWVDALLPMLKAGQTGPGLLQLLDRIEAALPPAPASAPKAAPGDGPQREDNILDRHPEWKLPFLLMVFSPFAIFPMFVARWGSYVSAPLFGAFVGGAAWALWESPQAAIGAAGVACVLPLLWGLNGERNKPLPTWLLWARAIGDLAGVLIFFSIITAFVGAGLSGTVDEVWAAPVFAGVLAMGLAVFLFPGKPAQVLMVVLRSVCHFVFMLVVAWVALAGVMAQPLPAAFAVAGIFTATLALALWFDNRAAGGHGGKRASFWLTALALLMVVPLGLLLLFHAALGGDDSMRLAEAAAGGGSVGGMLWWAARQGFFAAARIGMGGRFGGGGAQASD